MFNTVMRWVYSVPSERWLLAGFMILVIYGVKSYVYEKIFNNIGISEIIGWIPVYRWVVLCSYLVPGTKVGMYSTLPITAWIMLCIPVLGWLLVAYMRGSVFKTIHSEITNTDINTFLMFLFGFIPAIWFIIALIKYKKLPIE